MTGGLNRCRIGPWPCVELDRERQVDHVIGSVRTALPWSSGDGFGVFEQVNFEAKVDEIFLTSPSPQRPGNALLGVAATRVLR